MCCLCIHLTLASHMKEYAVESSHDLNNWGIGKIYHRIYGFRDLYLQGYGLFWWSLFEYSASDFWKFSHAHLNQYSWNEIFSVVKV